MKRFSFIILTALMMALVVRAESDELRRYGSLTHSVGLPNVLFLVGEIEQGDSFELRRAMRDSQIDLVVLGSAGGNLYEGLQIASILHDNGIDTFVPEGINCESSCANIFFAGTHRLALGNVGVHQFYSGSRDAGASRPADQTAAVTQYTTSDIIGILNGFDTPAFVYEKMFGTGDIYYFEGDERGRLDLNSDDPGFRARIEAAGRYIAENPDVVRRPSPKENVSESATQPPVDNAPSGRTGADRLYSDIDFFGMDLGASGVRNISLNECEAICNRDARCAAFSYVTATRWCWPKSGVENFSLAPGTISGIIDYARVNPGIFDRSFIEVTAADIPGLDIYPKGIKNLTLAQCRNTCEADTSCRAFSWVSKKNWCFPKYGVGRLTRALGTISGIRN